MKTYVKNLFLLPGLIAVLNLIPAGRVTAQTFTTPHSFTGGYGATPQAGVILSNKAMYGTVVDIAASESTGATSEARKVKHAFEYASDSAVTATPTLFEPGILCINAAGRAQHQKAIFCQS